jgi:hypothetical protein
MRVMLVVAISVSLIGAAHSQGIGQPYYGSTQPGIGGSYSVPGYRVTPNWGGGGSYTVTPTYPPPTQIYIPNTGYPQYLPPGQSPTFGYR